MSQDFDAELAPGESPAAAPAPRTYKDADRSGDRYAIRLRKSTGILIVGQLRTAQYRGTYEQCVAAYSDAQKFNLFFGWWSIPSIIAYQWMAIFGNLAARKHLRELAQR